MQGAVPVSRNQAKPEEGKGDDFACGKRASRKAKGPGPAFFKDDKSVVSCYTT